MGVTPEHATLTRASKTLTLRSHPPIDWGPLPIGFWTKANVSVDCYLCGATNSADDDYCAQCNGQLFSPSTDAGADTGGSIELPPLTLAPIEPPPIDVVDDASAAATDEATPPPVPEAGSSEDVEQTAPPPVPTAPPPVPADVTTAIAPSDADADPDDLGFDFGDGGISFGVDPDEARAEIDAESEDADTPLASISSVEHAALSSALGLDEDAPAPRRIATAASAPIPEIGTRKGSKTLSSNDMREKPVGTVSYVLLGVLALAVAWLAYLTITRGPATPDTIAFQGSTTTLPPSTTTEPVVNPWSAEEIEGRHGPSFVRVFLYACPTIPGSESTEVDVEPLAEHLTVGVAADAHNVITTTAGLPSANVAEIRSRFGSSTIALLHTLRGDLTVASATTSFNRNLDIPGDAPGDAAWWLHHDIESVPITIVSDASGDHELEVVVDKYGELVEVTAGAATARFDELRELDQRSEVADNPSAGAAKTVCDRANFILDTRVVEAAEAAADDSEGS